MSRSDFSVATLYSGQSNNYVCLIATRFGQKSTIIISNYKTFKRKQKMQCIILLPVYVLWDPTSYLIDVVTIVTLSTSWALGNGLDG